MSSGDTDPWSGDDVPVAPGLGDIVWDTPSALDAADAIDAETVTAAAAVAERPLIRRLLIPAAAVAAVGVVLLAILAWPGQSETTADEPPSSTPETPATLDTLPSTADSSPAATMPSEVSDAAVVEPEAELPFTALAPGELPAVLAEAELVTEVVIVTADGELVTLSLPDGTVTEWVDLGLSRTSRFDQGPTSLVVSPDAAIYTTGTDLVVVPAGGDPLPIDADVFELDSNSFGPIPFGWTRDVSGTNVFVVISFDDLGSQFEWLVNTSGEVSPAPAQRSGAFARPVHSLGTRIISDAGGAYRVDPNGDSNRISNGEVLAVSETKLLLRECNANRVCNAVLRNYQGEEVRIVDLPPSFQPGFLAASLSPDARAVVLGDPNFSGERSIIDLNSGETVSFAERASDVSPPTWASDSAGLFALGSDGGILFVDRVTGEEFTFALELGQIRAIATRSATG